MMGGVQVPPINCMGCPHNSDARFLMYDDLGARRCKGGTVVVKGTIDVCLNGYLGGDTGASQKIQGREALGKELLPYGE
jgi:hypothetical protein